MKRKRQARGAPQSSAAPAQAPNPITLSLPSPLKLQFDPNAQLQITVVTPDKPDTPLKRSLLLVIAIVIILTLLWFLLSLRYLALSYPQSTEFNAASLSIAMVHPAYVAYGDDAEMELTVTNRGSQNFTGAVTVSFPGAVPVRPLASETTTMKIEKLASGASATHRLKFALRQQARLFSGEVIPTALQITTDERSFQPTPGPQIAIAPLPFLRTINSWLSNSVVVAAVAALIWEVLRKRFFGWEAK